MKCQTCERRNKVRPNECQVMKKQFTECWAYTRDPYWNRKVRVAVARYEEGKNYNASYLTELYAKETGD